MENWKEELQKYLPDVEKFLTSVLLEETDIEISESEPKSIEAITELLDKSDIFLYAKDEIQQSDVIAILNKEWYGLLSSIMLGVEEKTNNEITRDLLKKFSSELSATMLRKLESDGYEMDLSDVQVLTKKQLEAELCHTEYFFAMLEVEGLADNKVKAAWLVGNPDAVEKEEPEPEPEPEEAKAEQAGVEKEFAETEAKEMERLGQEEEVISARQIQFDNFHEDREEIQNGDSRSMDLLKDVEMDVSVELGRIELPLGKVLQLAKGSVIELEKLAGEPVDILVNGHCIAHGEVVVIDEHFGVRISNLITTRQRIAGLQ
ncbi:MAG: flagellar motor switch protein FliN [Balneolaceae bacterium]|nr:flagellar motor switch protein FliN [Balneolaceae bacterium]MCH8547912.1 flagellar motor switch protein FliN [Balneolaceae bacterium]